MGSPSVFPWQLMPSVARCAEKTDHNLSVKLTHSLEMSVGEFPPNFLITRSITFETSS